MEHKCSRAHFAGQFAGQSQDIIQTPLLHDYDVKFYHLDLQVENNTVDIAGNVTFLAEVDAAQLDTFAFDLLHQLTVDSVLINGNPFDFDRVGDETFVPVSPALMNGFLFSARIYYHGTPPTGGFFSGISTAYDPTWGKNVTWTLSEPFNARQWWPCKQVLHDKADSVWVFLTTDENNLAGSNGLLTTVTPVGNSKLRFEWKSGYPINYYLISFAVAQYQDYSIYAKPQQLMGDSILIKNFIYDSPGCLENYKEGIDMTVEFLELFSDLYSLYPFSDEKYGHCLTKIGGGMEHQTMTTIGGFGFGLVSHELGHMWFGDNVTCATWSDIWINEGFATYSDYLAHEFIVGQNYPQIWMEQAHNFVMSAPGGTIYIPPEEITYENVGRIFDSRLSYYKGACILHMIRFELQDDDLFFQTLKNFQQEFMDSVATGLDFMGVLNVTSGKDFTGFFDQWYFGEGYPTYSILWNQSAGNFNFTVTQTTSTSTTPLFRMLMAYKLAFTDGTDTTVYVCQTDHVSSYSIPVNRTVSNIVVDPDNWVLNKVGSITVEATENISSFRFSLGPNPARDLIRLQPSFRSYPPYQLTLTGINGNKLWEGTFTENDIVLDVSGMREGIYFIRLRNGDGAYTRRFVKVR